jgi:hypothetical protein
VFAFKKVEISSPGLQKIDPPKSAWQGRLTRRDYFPQTSARLSTLDFEDLSIQAVIEFRLEFLRACGLFPLPGRRRKLFPTLNNLDLSPCFPVRAIMGGNAGAAGLTPTFSGPANKKKKEVAMPQDHVLRLSDLQTARARNDLTRLREMFVIARKILEAGGRVRVEEEFSDTTVETVKFIANVEELKEFETHYLSRP